MPSRREFLTRAATLTAVATTSALAETQPQGLPGTNAISLCGMWNFRLDPANRGISESWYRVESPIIASAEVTVPHTWQLDPAQADYRGVAWYRREFDLISAWHEGTVRIEFEAVFHSAKVWVNGELIGEHARKGYTAFAFDITPMLHWDGPNVIAVQVDNAFNEHMLPRGRSSDWANDGGIYRPVQLLITPKTFVEQVAVEAVPDLCAGDAFLTISARCKNTSGQGWSGVASIRVVDDETGLAVSIHAKTASFEIPAGKSHLMKLTAAIPHVKLWHFDYPKLYRLIFSIADQREEHEFETTFGVRKFEVKDGAFHLNGERVRLVGVERMAGSNPQFGMAEPSDWIEHDHLDLKDLNCIFTRVHWPQDKRVLDYCDRHGILLQTEVPSWGPDTFKGMADQPDADIMENGLEQLREMIARDRNHPSVVVWGLCNEIDGQNPPAYQFAKRMLEEAKRLDPGRLCSYASNSLGATPERDVAGLMDFIETNEYFGTWAAGTAQDAGQNLDQLHAAFPGKPIVISEYGYCACTPERPEGDELRIATLETHNAEFRKREFVGGAIFFCYNDYRTHIGDRGLGALQQRVHGVVDVYGARKPSYAILREQSSPIASLDVHYELNTFRVLVRTRRDLPAYRIRGYKVRGIFFGQGNIPVESQEIELSEILPGAEATVKLKFRHTGIPLHMRFDVLRPTGFSSLGFDWKA